MRLIDADEVKRFYEEEFPTLDNGIHWSRNDIIMNLLNIPTVKAIPIEWIKQKVQEHDKRRQIYTSACIEELLEDWEKENEQTDSV